MQYKVFGDTIAVRLNRGEEIVSSLEKICAEANVTAGTVLGIGAADRAAVGLYEVANRSYHKSTLEGEMEIASLTGNVSKKDGKVYLHLHIALAGQDGRVLGGHLNEARISGAGEIFIRKLPGEIGRIPDPDTGLNIFAWND